MSNTYVQSIPSEPGPKVLLIAESLAEATAIQSTLGSDLKRVTVADPRAVGHQFDQIQPEVVLFGFRALPEAQRHQERLYETSERAWAGEHSDIVLVHRDAVKEAFSLCARSVFDSYVLYWPQPYDVFQLRLSVSVGARHARLATQRLHLPFELLDSLHKAGSTGTLAPDEEASQLRRCFRDITLSLDGEQSASSGRDALRRAERHLVGLRQAIEVQSQALRAMRGWMEALPKRLLIVEEDRFQQQLLTHMLQADGFEVHVASTGQEALSVARRLQPSLIVLDYRLPDTNGVALTRTLKRIAATSEIPIIMTSADSNRGVVVESIQAGAADFLVKPLTRDTVRAKVKTRLQLGEGSQGRQPLLEMAQ